MLPPPRASPRPSSPSRPSRHSPPLEPLAPLPAIRGPLCPLAAPRHAQSRSSLRLRPLKPRLSPLPARHWRLLLDAASSAPSLLSALAAAGSARSPLRPSRSPPPRCFGRALECAPRLPLRLCAAGPRPLAPLRCRPRLLVAQPTSRLASCGLRCNSRRSRCARRFWPPWARYRCSSPLPPAHALTAAASASSSTLRGPPPRRSSSRGRRRPALWEPPSALGSPFRRLAIGCAPRHRLRSFPSPAAGCGLRFLAFLHLHASLSPPSPALPAMGWGCAAPPHAWSHLRRCRLAVVATLGSACTPLWLRALPPWAATFASWPL